MYAWHTSALAALTAMITEAIQQELMAPIYFCRWLSQPTAYRYTLLIV